MANEVLISLGIGVGPLVAGRPDIRGNSGYVFRWGEGRFEEIRDKGPGWSLQRDDKSAIEFRVNLLLDIFRPRRWAWTAGLVGHHACSHSDEPQELG